MSYLRRPPRGTKLREPLHWGCVPREERTDAEEARRATKEWLRDRTEEDVPEWDTNDDTEYA